MATGNCCIEYFTLEFICCKFFIELESGVVYVYDSLTSVNLNNNLVTFGSHSYNIQLAQNTEFNDATTFLAWYKTVCCEPGAPA